MPTKTYKRYTITAALPYANGPIHIGHLAGVYIPADIYVRYLRQNGADVVFICGSDEHGVPITIRARKEQKTPQQIADKYHALIKDSFDRFGISFNIYSRTSNDIHYQTASDFFTKLYQKGIFREIESDQFYDSEMNEFLADRYIKGTCPRCGYAEAFGDQCEHCGSTLSPAELVNPQSMLSGSKPVLKSTKHWYLPLDEFEPWLRKWILDGHKEWKTNVYGQCKSWIDQGLQPRAVTRDLDWGVPVPLKEAEGKVLYVWFDAPIGYISATREWGKRNEMDWEPYWKSEDTRLVHFIGKDNIVFHCIIFPSMLKNHGEFILPDNVPANEFLNLEGNKISTSRNWAVWLHEYLEDFPEKEDVLRYTLCSNMPETKDNDFTWKDFQAKNNNELVAILGNFVNRAVVLTQKYYEGKIPETGDLFDIDHQLISFLKRSPSEIAGALDQFKFRDALAKLMEVARAGNKYLADNEPWKLIKTDPDRVKTVMNLAIQVVGFLSQLAEPFLPFTAQKIRDMLDVKMVFWPEGADVSMIPAGHIIREPHLLFEKIEDKAVEAQMERLLSNRKTNEQSTGESEAGEKETPNISFEEFMKLDLRVGKILSAEPIKKSDKLLKLTVDTGADKRTIVSGIAQSFNTEEVVGKQVTVLMNLAPRKIMGVESQGMILLSEEKDGKLIFIVPETAASNGSNIR